MLFLWKEGGLLYPVSEAFLQAVQENTRRYYWTGRITTTESVTYEFGASDIVKGSGYISSQCCGSTEIELGTVYAAEMGITLFSDIDRYTLEDALVELFYHLRLSDGTFEEIPMLDKEVYQRRRADFARLAEKLDADILELEQRLKAAETVKDDSLSQTLGVMKKYSGEDELTQAMVKELIEKVIVTDPEHVEIVWKFKDEVRKFIGI